jgi:hypothetical protein
MRVMQIPTVVAEAKKALEEGCSVVIGLQTTGEAAADAMGIQPGDTCGFVSTARELLSRFTKMHFPVRFEEKDQPQGPPLTSTSTSPIDLGWKHTSVPANHWGRVLHLITTSTRPESNRSSRLK